MWDDRRARGDALYLRYAPTGPPTVSRRWRVTIARAGSVASTSRLATPICADQHLDIAVRIGHGHRMATDKSTVAFIVDQLSVAGDVSAKPMFGEYGIYCDGKMFGMICDGQLFIKSTARGRTLGSDLEEAPPYPGAKPSLLVDPDRWDDGDWLAELVRVTITELPAPKPKVRKSKAG